jgi:hypothetical protein
VVEKSGMIQHSQQTATPEDLANFEAATSRSSSGKRRIDSDEFPGQFTHKSVCPNSSHFGLEQEPGFHTSAFTILPASLSF